MAITADDVTLFHGGAEVTSGQMNNIFPDGKIGGTTTYEFVELRNEHATDGLTSVAAWLGLDDAGGTIAIALGDASAQVLSWGWSVDPTGLTYTSPTTEATGIALPNLPAQRKALIAIRRVLTGASTAYPESNSLIVGGTPS